MAGGDSNPAGAFKSNFNHKRSYDVVVIGANFAESLTF
jgi:hypothetical protein